MSQTTTCLFGGALMAAGIANAQPQFDLIDLPGDVELYAYAYDSATYQFGYAFGSIGTIAYTFPSAGSTVSLSETLASIDVYVAPGGFINIADSAITSEFTVSQAVTGRASWDLSVGAGDVSLPQLRVFDLTNQSVLFTLGASNGANGSIDLSLTPGVTYGLEMSGLAVGTAGTSISLSFAAIPAPGTLGLLGLAGVAAARRRRG